MLGYATPDELLGVRLDAGGVPNPQTFDDWSMLLADNGEFRMSNSSGSAKTEFR